MSPLHPALLASVVVTMLACAPPPRDTNAVPVGVSTAQQAVMTIDPLSAWNEGPTKQAIRDFVVRVSAPGSPDALPLAERIATFDNDGTLWPEKPPAEAAFVVSQLKSEALDDARLRTEEPFRSLLLGDTKAITSLGIKDVLAAVARTHTGMRDDTFEAEVRTFLFNARHPRFGVPYPALAYRPMRQLLAYLREHEFTIYICTGGDERFVRAFAQETYSVPREHVIGSSFKKQLVIEDGGTAALQRKPELATFNDKEEKAENIALHIGRRPVLAAGNVGSGGDVAMLQYTRLRAAPALALVVNHDDPVREFEYAERDGATLEAARKYGFVVVSMKNDWSEVFDPPPQRR